jgi:hypothetical protein
VHVAKVTRRRLANSMHLIGVHLMDVYLMNVPLSRAYICLRSEASVLCVRPRSSVPCLCPYPEALA